MIFETDGLRHTEEYRLRAWAPYRNIAIAFGEGLRCTNCTNTIPHDQATNTRCESCTPEAPEGGTERGIKDASLVTDVIDELIKLMDGMKDSEQLMFCICCEQTYDIMNSHDPRRARLRCS